MPKAKFEERATIQDIHEAVLKYSSTANAANILSTSATTLEKNLLLLKEYFRTTDVGSRVSQEDAKEFFHTLKQLSKDKAIEIFGGDYTKTIQALKDSAVDADVMKMSNRP